MKKKRMRGTVQKVIKPVNGEPEKAQVDIHEAEDLYREIRVENVVTDDRSGEKAGLKEGAEVDVVIEADSSATARKPA
jgi:hypothetical protein